MMQADQPASALLADWIRQHLPEMPELTDWQKWFYDGYMQGNWYIFDHRPARRRRMHMAYSARQRARRRRH